MKVYKYDLTAGVCGPWYCFNAFVWYKSKCFYEVGIRRCRKWLIVVEQ